VLDQSNPIQRFAIGASKRWSTIGLFTKEGAKHIWSGADHLLFLLTLLLPGLMLTAKPMGGTDRADATAVRPRANRQAQTFALKVITAFTLAHSVTLAFSVFGLIHLPEKLVESAIALSIIISAGLNLYKVARISHWKLAFFFGLIHGMGFANGLKDLGLSQSYFVETLLAFNLGVELGQISAVVVVAVPVLMLARGAQAKERVLKYGSWGVLILSCFWLVQRLAA
jgi:HupE / UreJ protein